ncbi:carbonic anhydrase [Methylobrevis pamukkalensis]|uniref:Carbonic anhydrase n=1 Tax=Methylobrevis pamukkalensis TaxID=1439726 RepID=A0A1E3H870_9HYPH|nr:carbonic anhydrase [Methylobrevis pamukkalensis]ODN72520.1 Carbonic anhydrase 1 [Methylobrevis pamukkalensis]
MSEALPSAFPDRLLSGYKAFRDTRFPTEQSRFRCLAESGQQPEVMIIGCCDSRVSPEVIFDAGPGEIFVVRNVANLIPPYQPDRVHHGTSAALEFAIVALRVKHVVVMGHGRCGGVHAALTNPDPLTTTDFIGRWMSLVKDEADRVRSDEAIAEADKQTQLEHDVVRRSLKNLMTFPCVQTRTSRGNMKLHGAWFDVGLGELHVLDPETDVFGPYTG